MTSFSAETFIVGIVRRTRPFTFILTDSRGVRLDQPVYEENLIKCEPDYKSHRRVDRIISSRKARTRFASPERLVRYREKAAPDEWLSSQAMEKLKMPFD